MLLSCRPRANHKYNFCRIFKSTVSKLEKKLGPIFFLKFQSISILAIRVVRRDNKLLSAATCPLKEHGRSKVTKIFIFKDGFRIRVVYTSHNPVPGAGKLSVCCNCPQISYVIMELFNQSQQLVASCALVIKCHSKSLQSFFHFLCRSLFFLLLA